VNNYDWFKDMGFLRFIREVGKHITVNYMMSKDSVKSRLETGISFTEFSYQLVQGYDFYWLWKHKGVRFQMGGSDQWGNITTGTELIRRMGGEEAVSNPAFAITTPLLTKADGSNFGKSEGGNIWLDAKRTSPYRFYQFWLNTADAESEKCLRIFTTWEQERVEALIAEHAKAPHQRALQRALAEEITSRVHGREELKAAQQASAIPFGSATADALDRLTDRQWLEVFEGVPQAEVPRERLMGAAITDLLTELTGFLPSKGEAKRALKEGSISVNRQKVEEAWTADANRRFLLLQRGKKNYFLVKVAG